MGRDLPGPSSFVLAPTACALLGPVSHYRVPIPIGFGLVGGSDFERECFALLELGPTIEPQAADPQDREVEVSMSPFR
jgi:hypothetical protein